MRSGKRIALAAAVSVLAIAVGASLGSASIGLGDTVTVIFRGIFAIPLGDRVDPVNASIVWLLRLPRVLLAFLAGGALAVSGAACQSVLRNPLATPHILGVSSGASLGAGIVIISGAALPFLGGFTLPAVGFASALATVFLVAAFAARIDRSMASNTIILCGLVASLFLNAVLTTLSAVFSDDLRRIALWQMGSFAMRGWSHVRLLLPFLLVGVVGILAMSREMDILTFGDDHAKSSGIESGRVRGRLLALSAVLTGATVALCGVIGFVDLITPHAARKLVGAQHKSLVPMSFFLGGSLMVITDLVARTAISPSELPVGALTALIGAPFFAWVYFRQRGTARRGGE